MQTPASERVPWFHSGEVVLVARVRGLTNANQLHAAVRDVLPKAAIGLADEPDSMRSFIFSAPPNSGENRALAFVFQDLASASELRAVTDVVEQLHAELPNMQTDAVEVFGAMPHWHTWAHEMSSGGSPGSYPAPVEVPDSSRRWRYRPRPDVLRMEADATAIPVAVLDTNIDLVAARDRAANLANPYLVETIELLQQHAVAPDDVWQREWAEVLAHHPPPDPSEPRFYLPDHGLFIAGLIHDLAPKAPVTLVPALNESGVGNLSLLLAALRQVLDRKDKGAPQIVNLSLGFRPHPADLVAAWFGLDLPGTTATFTPAPILQRDGRDRRWVAGNGPLVSRRMDLLQTGLAELGRYLALNNCLVVAAAGNDSVAGELRLEPRLPARFETVLGVAATRLDGKPASYSNVGDEQRRGDHVATFGGERGQGFAPLDGVTGIYSGAFPGDGPNRTGWASWAGTSFATAIVSGIAANVWARNPSASAGEILAEVHELALNTGTYVSELRTPSIALDGAWA